MNLIRKEINYTEAVSYAGVLFTSIEQPLDYVNAEHVLRRGLTINTVLFKNKTHRMIYICLQLSEK